MAKINKLLGPGEHIVLKDIIVSGCTEIQMIKDIKDIMGNPYSIKYGGVRPKYIVSNLIPSKTVVNIIKHTKDYRNGGFVSELILTCSDDRFYTYSCVIYGDTHDVIMPLEGAGKLLYGTK